MTKATNEQLRILIAGGGTGGHLFPGLAIADSFKGKRSCDIRFVGTRRGIEVRVLPQSGYRLYTIPVSGLYRVGRIRQLQSLLKLPLAFLKSLWLLLRFRPHLVVGIGGYASGPVLTMAVLLGHNTILQEQNAYPGMTNRILGKWVPLAFVPFDGTEQLFRKPVVVGNPVRRAIIDAASLPDPRKKEPFVISILGGSQGARILNRTVTAALPLLAPAFSRLRVVHQSGPADLDWVQSAYSSHPELDSVVKPFFDDIADVLLQSHLLICRAGSMVNEINAIGRASILVPIAVSSGNHQLENARKMSVEGAAITIEESELTPEVLGEAIRRLLETPERRRGMEKAAKALFPGDSAEIIVDRTIAHYRL